MDREYDLIVLGTGMKECVLGGILSGRGRSVLQLDRNSYYGGDAASLNLEELFSKFHPEEKIPDSLGPSKEYNVDLTPKFVMACGNLVKVLLHAKVTHYLDFKSVKGSYVYKDGTVHKVPATAMEAMKSDLMGMAEKARFKSFVSFCDDWEANDEKTWKGHDLNKMTTRELFARFNLEPSTTIFTGHALALHLDDAYLDLPARDTVEQIKLYAHSVNRYGSSPYVYPIWGLGGLAEGFSRLCAVNGGVFMLNKPVDEILYDDSGGVCGVKSQGEVARCKKLVADPSYFVGTDKVKKTGQVARCICILSHPLPNTSESDSCQVIVPHQWVKPERKTDMYVSCVSFHHRVAPQNKWIACVSATVETSDARKEIEPVMQLLGSVDREFFWVSDTYEPVADGSKDNVFISKSYDATSHFETATDDVLDMFRRITGEELDLTISAEPEDLQ